jgi:hypothetical protein
MRLERIAPVALLVLAVVGAGCGSRTVRTTVPFDEATREGGPFSGWLVLDDGRRLRVGDAALLGPWLCTGAGRGDVCFEAERVTALEREETHAGPGAWAGKGVALVAMWPVIAIWLHSEHESDRKSRAAAEVSAERRRRAEARAAARGEVLPPEPTAESARRDSAFYGLANCHHVADRDATDGATLAGLVWKDRGDCLDEAVAWFRLTGEVDKARRLEFMVQARRRAEAMVCWPDPGLRAPEKEFVGAAGRTWMDEYRAVVADPRTYDYAAAPSCESPQARAEPWTPGVDPVEAARTRARASFPLTDPEALSAAIARQVHMRR